jgi:hypothetical protein
MAHAQFHKNQRVYVRPVGTWARIERVIPQWTKGLDEPIRIHYDVGLGREFAADELHPETDIAAVDDEGERWHLVRARNKWQSDAETAGHPYPGTYPVIATSESDTGGWRVPGAEYAVSPMRIERQARILVCGPMLAAIAKQLWSWAKAAPEDVPDALHQAILQARDVVTYMEDGPE